MSYEEDGTTVQDPSNIDYSANPQPANGENDEQKPEPDQATKNLVGQWLDRIQAAKKFWKPTFDQIAENQDFAYYGADKKWAKSGKYVVPILARHINQSVSVLYARNPKVLAKRRKRVKYTLWDGRQDSLQAAMQMAQMGDPQAMQLLQEVLAVRQQDLMIDRLGKTLEIVYEYFQNEQAVNFKQQLKSAVRRAKVNKVAYIKLGLQRVLEQRPEIVAEINDVTSKISTMQQILREMKEGEVDVDDAQMAELKTLLQDLQNQEYLIAREGLVFDFPKTTEIIIDPACRHLKSLVGARWACQMFEGPTSKIEQIYEVDVGEKYTQYRSEGRAYDKVVDAGEEPCARWYEVWDHRDEQWFTVCEGYDGFLKPPQEPDIYMDRFWPIFPVVFNEVEHDEQLYPPSDIEHGKHIQNEYNRSREALRQHRIAARPAYVEGGGMSEDEKKRLANHADHEIITLPSLGTGEDIGKKLQRLPVANIDPNLYETEMHYTDLQRSVGSQSADLGAPSPNGTATDASIAEQSRGASLSDNVDDLDEVLSELAHAGGQVLLKEMSKDKVIEIAGQGAVWPDMPETRDQISKDLYLDIKAGSSGRPNRAAELANRERALPMLLQLPGVNPTPLVEGYADLLDIDAEELIADGVPSIQAINAAMAKAAMGAGGPPGGGASPGGPPGPGGKPNGNPVAQGPAGANNAPSPQVRPPGPQPAMPAPMPGHGV